MSCNSCPKHGRLVMVGAVLLVGTLALAIPFLFGPNRTDAAQAPEPGAPKSTEVAVGPVAALKAATEPSGAKVTMSMFGVTPHRNMVNLVDKNIPSDWDIKTGKNIKWMVKLGSRAYGGPIVADGKIYCGTNNKAPRNPNVKGDKGVLMCFRESDGEFLWQAIHNKLESGMVNDWPHEGVCSTPTIVGDRLYYVSNRCEVICAGTKGLPNDKDKKVQIIWRYDMIKELNVFPHNMSACCPLVYNDMIYVVTANGVDEDHSLPSPHAPSFIALNKDGKLVWRDSSPGKNVMHGQRSNPTLYEADGKAQIIFPGGDGWLRGFDPKTGEIVWRFDANPKDAKYELGGKGTKSDFIGTPVVYDNKIYIGTGQDPEHFTGVAYFYCIDPRGKKHDVSPDLVEDDKVFPPKTKPNPNSAVVWKFGGPIKPEDMGKINRDFYFGRTMSTASIHDGLIYIAELEGFVHCLDAKTGQKYWEHDLKAASWGSTYWVDNKIFIATEDGDVFIFEHGKTKKPPKRIEMDARVRCTAMAANGVLYIMTEHTLYAIAANLAAVGLLPSNRQAATLDSEGSVRIWDLATSREAHSWTLPTETPRENGNNQAAGSGNWNPIMVARADRLYRAGSGDVLRSWVLSTGKELATTPLTAEESGYLVISGDGRFLACVAAPGTVSLRDPATGKDLRRFQGFPGVSGLYLSADGGTLLVHEMGPPPNNLKPGQVLPSTLHFVDTESGTIRRRIEVAEQAQPITLSADGRLALAGESLIESFSGAVLGKIPRLTVPYFNLTAAFSPDGQTLAGPDLNGAIHVYDVVGARKLGRFEGHRGQVDSLVFSQDGKGLLSGGADTSALIWDLQSVLSKRAELSKDPQDAQARWSDMAGDAVKAREAIRYLSVSPAIALPLLRANLKPMPEMEQIKKHIANLGSERFEVRQQASRQLEKLGELAEAALREALNSQPGLEIQQRLEKVLSRLSSGPALAPEKLRAVRAVEVLELIGSAEARDFLRELSRGASGAWPTREAKAALRRLDAKR